MATVEGTGAIINRPVEDVWAFMLDISNMPRWEDSKAQWRQTSEGPIGVGTTFDSSIRILGRNTVFNLRVTAFEPNRRFAAQALNGFGRGTEISYVFESLDGDRTRLHRVTDAHLHGFAGLLRPILSLIVRLTGGAEAKNVTRLVESEGS